MDIDKKELVIIHKGCVADFPPLLAFLTFLKKKGVKIYLVIGYEKADLEDIVKPLCFEYTNLNVQPSSNKIIYWLKVRNEFWSFLEKKKYLEKILWIPAADTTLALGKKLLKYNYVLNLYELFDYQFMYVRLLKKYAKKANLVVCSNLDRANIVKVWWNLKEMPEVILNKPLPFKKQKKLPLPNDLEKVFQDIKDKQKIVLLYQGLISKERPLEMICKLVLKHKENLAFVIMGRKNKYLEELKKLCPDIIHIGFVAPPIHLHITSYADIGILNYDHSSLNNIFCAPNKLWEFSNFSIPMIGNKIPGLLNTIEKFKMGKCVDFDNEEELYIAIEEIVSNYSLYSGNSNSFYNDYDYDYEVSRILNKIFLK